LLYLPTAAAWTALSGIVVMRPSGGLYLKGDTSQHSRVPANGNYASCGHKKELRWYPAFEQAFYDDGGTDAMLAIGMLAAAAGLILGLRFSVITFVLLTLSIAIIFAIGVWGGGSPLVIVLQMLATLASVQISYLFGCLLAAHLPTRAKTASGRTQIRTLA
jgi:hypothetical protein